MKQILLIMIGLSSLICADFSRSTEGVVTDNKTNLQWQDDYSDNSGNIKQAIWQGAIDYCESLSLDGVGWRLPNLNELTSLVDDTTYNPTIYSVFLNMEDSFYWTSTTMSYQLQSAWIVYFGHGSQLGSGKNSSTIRVMCVRAGQ